MNVPINAFKYLVWQHNGCEGWSWEGYNTIEEAVKHESYGSKKIITTPVKIKIEDITPALDTKQEKCPACNKGEMYNDTDNVKCRVCGGKG
jgi:hypothetical protein